MFNYKTFPNPHMVIGLELYFERGIEPGSFMTAVLCNDLKGACARADWMNQRLIFQTVEWLYNEAPAGSWGSPEAYETVIRAGGSMGRNHGSVVLEGEAVEHIETLALEAAIVSEEA
jgi:hypothetical protein